MTGRSRGEEQLREEEEKVEAASRAVREKTSDSRGHLKIQRDAGLPKWVRFTREGGGANGGEFRLFWAKCPASDTE